MRHSTQPERRTDALDYKQRRSLHDDGDLDHAWNDQIEHVLQRAFAPHRCQVEFQEDGRKVALRLHVVDGREIFVDAKRVKSLRDPHALAEYARDVKACLERRGIRFNDKRAESARMRSTPA